MDGQMDEYRQTDRQTDRQMDGWANTQMDEEYSNSLTTD